jgi:hypothetical protein
MFIGIARAVPVRDVQVDDADDTSMQYEIAGHVGMQTTSGALNPGPDKAQSLLPILGRRPVAEAFKAAPRYFLWPSLLTLIRALQWLLP